MNRLKFCARRFTAALLIAATGGACTPERVTVVELQVSIAGSYRVSGQEVPKERLFEVVRGNRPATGKFGVHLIADPKAPAEAVSFATATATEAGATVGMVGNEKF